MSKPLLVLIVDAEPTICDLFADYLHELGINSVQAYGAAEACAILKDVRVDLVLIDHELPQNGASAVYGAAVTLRPEMHRRFIFTCTMAEPLKRVENGCLLLSKPFRFEELARAVRSICDRSSARIVPQARRAGLP
ncbi:MAG: hypothetical protein KIS92_07490 [Planctomycetota bacterium]|nr:hypothetical protein [Planctomycetota bacterium]